jgi:two-component system response regulator HydG
VSNSKINEFHKKLDLAITQPLNMILEGENGVGKEYFAKLIHDRRNWTKDFIIFDWECDYSSQLKVLDDLFKNHLTKIIDLSNQKRNTYFFRRIDLLNSKAQLQIYELLENESKRFGLSRSQFHQLGLIASQEKKNGNGNKKNDFTFGHFLEFFPLMIKIPALRHRKEELFSLMRTILESVNKKQNRMVLGFSIDAFCLFSDYDWPNNIDELGSEIERMLTLTRDNDLIKRQVISERLIKHQKFLELTVM